MKVNINRLAEYAPVRTVLDHCYLKEFRSGRLPKNHIEKIWVIQQAWLSRSFSHCMASLYSQLPSFLIAFNGPLLNIVNSESWGNGLRASHPKLFQNLLNGIGVNFKMDALPPCLLSTKEFIEKRQHYLIEGNIFNSLGLLVANEYLNSDTLGENGIMVSYLIGLQKHGYSEDDYEYCQAHVEEEKNDVAIMMEIFEALENEKEKLNGRGYELDSNEEFMNGVNAICKFRIQFFDGLFQSVGSDDAL